MTLTQDEQSTLTSLTSLAEQMAMEMSEDQLLREIGLRVRTLAVHPAAAGRVEMSVPEAAALERAWDDLNEFGGWIFRRLHRQLQSVQRGNGDRAMPEAATAGGIVSILTATLGVAPAIASVVTALALKRLLKPGWEETYGRQTQLVSEAR